MRFAKLIPFLAAAVAGTFAAAPSFAACQTEAIVYPVINWTGTISASQNITFGAGSTLTSGGGAYHLLFQADGNLVYYNASNSPRWASDTTNCLPSPNVVVNARFQPDGNLVVYWAQRGHEAQPFSVWDSGTDGHPNATLKAQDDGNLVIYDGTRVLWSIF